jgi:MYXO-CTERM domain-containing protein
MRRTTFLALGTALVMLAMGMVTPVSADALVVSYHTGGTQDYTYTNGTTSTLVTTGGPISTTLTLGSDFANFSPATLDLGDATVTMSASSTDSVVSGLLQQGFSGSIALKNESGSSFGGVANGDTILTINFSDATLVNQGGGAYSFGGSASISVNPLLDAKPIQQPESFSLSLSGATSSSFGNFTANDSGNASATLTPEPSSMALAALGALGLVGYGLRRRRARTA